MSLFGYSIPFNIIVYILYALISTIIGIVALIIAINKFLKSFSKKIKVGFIAKLLALVCGDAVSIVVCSLLYSIYSLLIGNGFVFTINSIPLISRIIRLKNIRGNLVQLIDMYRYVVSICREYAFGYAFYEVFPSVCSIINIIDYLFIEIYVICFLIFKRVKKEKKVEPAKESVEPTVVQQTVSKPAPKKYVVINDEFVIEELKKYKTLLDSGVLTREEFDSKKKQLLNLD